MRLPIEKSYGSYGKKPADKQGKRRLKNARITHVSLVRRGRNKMPVVMKSGGRFEIETICKAVEDGELLHTLVYVPERPDTDEDVASRDEIRKMAHDFLGNGGNVDIEHDLIPLGPDRVRIAETFVVQKGDPRFQGWTDYSGEPVDADGSWAMIFKLLDPALKSAAKRGELNGVSMFGHAEVEQIHKTAELPDPETEEDEPMKPDEIKELAQAVAESTAAAVVKALKPEAPKAPETPKAPAEPEKVKPVFKGDPRDQKALAAFQEECLLASLDLSNSKDMATWQAHIAKSQKKDGEGDEAEGGEAGELKAQIAALTARLDKVSKSSSVPVGKGKDDEKEPAFVGLSKAESGVYARGRSIAAAFNKQNGRE